MFDSTMLYAILPEILILVLAGFILVFDLIWSEDRKSNLGWLSAGGLTLILAATLVLSRPESDTAMVWGGMLRYDWLGVVFKLLFVFGAAIGAVVGLLVAPKSGKELRADLQATAEKDLSKLQAEWQAAMAKTNERLDQIQADLKKATQKAQGEEGEVEAEPEPA